MNQQSDSTENNTGVCPAAAAAALVIRSHFCCWIHAESLMVGQITKTGVCRLVSSFRAHCDSAHLQPQLQQTCGLLSPHYHGPLGWHIHGQCGCYEALENIISMDHQACCVEGATDCHWWTHSDSWGLQECFWLYERNYRRAHSINHVAGYGVRLWALVVKHITGLLSPPYSSRHSSGLWPSDSVVFSLVCWHVDFRNINPHNWHTGSAELLNISLTRARVHITSTRIYNAEFFCRIWNA